jgi:type III pantothenate kinase
MPGRDRHRLSHLVIGHVVEQDPFAARIEELGVAPGDVRVISTGYLAPLVTDDCRCFTDSAPWLTLRGLELVFGRNA